MPVSTGMGRRITLLAVAAVTAVLHPSAASAEEAGPVLVGSRCNPTAVVQNRTLLVAGADAALDPIVPRGAASVITGWEVEGFDWQAELPQRLQVYETTGSTGAYMKVAESRTEAVSFHGGSFETRIPVDGGESVGLSGGIFGTLACGADPAAVSLRADGEAEVGETRAFVRESGVGTPVIAIVERDSDEDGYGDESQDRCPGTASRGSDCPIRVRITRTEVKRRAILLEMKPAARATIEVDGEVRWRRAGRELGFDLSGGTKQVRGGRSVRFRVPLSRPVLQRLDRMRPGKSITARIEVFITDRDGWFSEKDRRVVLWGRR
jgi:hypothetical protein